MQSDPEGVMQMGTPLTHRSKYASRPQLAVQLPSGFELLSDVSCITLKAFLDADRCSKTVIQLGSFAVCNRWFSQPVHCKLLSSGEAARDLSTPIHVTAEDVPNDKPHR